MNDEYGRNHDWLYDPPAVRIIGKSENRLQIFCFTESWPSDSIDSMDSNIGWIDKADFKIYQNGAYQNYCISTRLNKQYSSYTDEFIHASEYWRPNWEPYFTFYESPFNREKVHYVFFATHDGLEILDFMGMYLKIKVSILGVDYVGWIDFTQVYTYI